MLNLLNKRMARTLASMPKTMLTTQPVRGIKLHEYQAGALLDSFKVKIPLGVVATSVDETY